MAYPTKSLILNVEPSALGTEAAKLDGLANSIEIAARNVADTINSLDWSGRSRDTAVARGENEKVQQVRVAAALDSLREAATSGSTGLQAIVDIVRPKVVDLEQRSYAVSDDWSVTDTYHYDLDDPGLDQTVVDLRKALQTHRANEAANATASFKSSAVSFQEIDDDTARKISAAIELLGRLAPVAAGLSGADGSAITTKIGSGSALTPTELAQLATATDLTPEQKQALVDGKPATMSQGQYDFLMEMMRALDNTSPSQIDSALASLPPDQRDVVRGDIGDALRLAGNPNTVTSAGNKGGMAQLPTAIRELLTESPTSTNVSVSNGYTNPILTDIPKLKQFDALNNVLSRGDQGLRLGSDVDRGLLKQAAEIAGATGGDGSTEYLGSYSDKLDIEHVNRTVDAMLNNASGDHIAVADFLSGGNMDATVTEGNHYDPNSHFLDLVTHPWDEDQRGAINVLDWIGENADAPGHEGELAGRSADSIAHLLIDNQELLSGRIPNDDPPGSYTSIGQVNPHLTQTLAVGMSPYLGNFVGVPDYMSVNDDVPKLANVSELSNVFKVLDSDPTAAQVMHSASAQWQNNIAYQFGLHPDESYLGFAAGQLNQGTTEGLLDQMTVLRENKQWENIVEFNIDSTTYDTVNGMLAAIPVPGFSEGLGVVSPSVKFDMIAIPNDPASLSKEQWDTIYDDLEQNSQSDSIVRSYSKLEGYAIGREALRDEFVYLDRTFNVQRSFFRPDGRLDWDAVSDYPGDFRRLVQELPFDNYEDEYNSGLVDEAIDTTAIPAPPDPSRLPNP